MVRSKRRAANVRVTGPLAPYAEVLRSDLSEQGYAPWTVAERLRVTGHLSRWMLGHDVTPGGLTGDPLEMFLAAQRVGGYGLVYTMAELAPLLRILRGLGVVPAERDATAGNSASELLLASFRRYLLNERGLAPSTTRGYVARVRRYLARDVPGLELAGLGAGDITAAVLAEARRVPVTEVQNFVFSLRAFLRFCFVEGLIPVDLSEAALTVTGRRSSSLPRGIDRASARALLGSCDRRTADGRRDYAVILTLLRLGLRASEAAGLVLEDIDWRSGQIVVHGKGARTDVLPLPGDVGEAIAGYLQRGRPVTTCRAVFLRTYAPIRGMGRGGVSCIVRRACVRAGIPKVGPHRLRHTAACEMVAAGVPISEIGQVLRHRSVGSTTNYARLDVEALRGLAQPWPAGRPR